MSKLRGFKAAVVVLAAILVTAFAASAQKPNFGAAIYGDGKVWGTKGTADLPPPNEHNAQSFDKLFMVVNSNNPGVQLPVAEAAPGNPEYNGGRWATYVVMWTAQGLAAHGTVPILTSYSEIQFHQSLGHLTIAPGAIGGPQMFFECPLLPFKGQ
ncbi:MAG: hypothetical protein HY820_41215 [Acidobacteria bacterium]|nr:hypothetical protein [Acidobacteriota bacterium]